MSSPPTSDGNHRVTNAILSTKLDALTEHVESLDKSLNRRLDFLEEKLELNVGDVREKCRANSTEIARLEERQKATTSILTGLNILVGSIAATIGALFK